MVEKILKINCQTGEQTEAEFTAEEISQREADSLAYKTANENAKAEQATLKANAKAKLIAGEALTEAEADTIVL